MSGNSGLFVLSVAEARATARAGGIGLVEHNGDSVALTYSDGAFTVEPAGLFSDGALAQRVAALLQRHDDPSVDGVSA